MSSFFERWSARARENRRAEPAPEAGSPPDSLPESLPEPAAAPAPEGAELERLLAELPPLETITSSTDIRPFLQSFVPKALKNAALRRAWAADPVISTHLDVARDYAWDFNTGTGPVGYSASLGEDIVQKSLDLLKRAEPPQPPEPEAEIPPETPEDLPPETGEGQNVAEIPPLRLSLRHGGALPG